MGEGLPRQTINISIMENQVVSVQPSIPAWGITFVRGGNAYRTAVANREAAADNTCRARAMQIRKAQRCRELQLCTSQTTVPTFGGPRGLNQTSRFLPLRTTPCAGHFWCPNCVMRQNTAFSRSEFE